MAKTPESMRPEMGEGEPLQQLVSRAESIALRITELYEQKQLIEQQIEELSEERRSKMEKIANRNKIGDNIIIVLSLPNGGLDPEDLKQIGLAPAEGKSVSSVEIEKRLEDSGWVDLGARPYAHEDYDDLEGRVWVKK